MSTKTLGVFSWGSGRQNSIPTIPTIPTVPTFTTIPTPWVCSKLKPWRVYYQRGLPRLVYIKIKKTSSLQGF